MTHIKQYPGIALRTLGWIARGYGRDVMTNHYLNSRRLILANIWPANGLQMLVVAFLFLGFFYVVRWQVAIQAVVPWGLVFGGLVTVFFATPPKVVYWFLNLPGLVQSLLAGLTFYVSVVLLAHAIDLKNLAAVWEILTVTKGAPLTPSHVVGAVGAFYFFKRNYYDGKPALKPAEIYLRGPKLISEEEAKKKAGAVVSAYLDAMMKDQMGAQLLIREYLDGAPRTILLSLIHI